MQTIILRISCEDENTSELVQSLSRKVEEALTEHSSSFGGSSTSPQESYEIALEQPLDRDTGELAVPSTI